jgi:hypothetical protein
MVNIIGLNPKLARIVDLALLVTHTAMYIRIQVWLKTRDGMGS